MMPAGTLALVLHGHLPFVRHPEHERFLEEDWLFEAITECYLPLLDAFERLVDRGVRFRLTMCLSPTLLSMLHDELLGRRYVLHLERLVDLAEREVHRTVLDSQMNRLARMYADGFRRARSLFCERFGGDLIGAFARLADEGVLELITCAATHAYLPLLQFRPEAVAAQIRTAVRLHRRLLGRRPRGIWLPECGFYEGLDRVLDDCGLGYFFVDTHGLLHAVPRPRFGVFAPVVCPGGPAAFGRDLASSRQVWSSVEGYPGDPEYREFYRDIGHDLDLDYIGPFVQPTGLRKDTGIKYHRITGPVQDKKLYRPERAARRVAEHAAHFVSERVRQIEVLAKAMEGREPIVVAPYDAELFGHWWYEGPRFLEHVLRDLACRSGGPRTDTPGAFLDRQSSLQLARPSPSSWGRGGHSQIWLDESNDWIYNHMDHASGEMIALAASEPDAGGIKRRALDQAARELMLAQASDWAFLIKTQTAVQYAVRRTHEHLANFNILTSGIRKGRVDVKLLQSLEQRHNLFPEMDYRCYRP